MPKLRDGFVYVLIALVAAPALAVAQIVVDKEDEGNDPPKGSFWMPYYFKTEAMDNGFGVSYSGGLFESSGGIFAAVYGTANGSWGVNFGGLGYNLGNSRWKLDLWLNYEDNEEQRFYGDLASPVGAPAGGSHGSPADDFLTGPGRTIYLDTTLRYPFAIGDGRENQVARYQTNAGLLVGPPSGGKEWNPFRSGRTELTVMPFYQLRNIKISDENVDQFPPVLGLLPGDTAEHKTNGIEVALIYDNRDFMQNPERGSFQKLAVTRDFGWFDSTDSWTAIQFDYAKYFSLGASDAFRQKVLAVKAWTAYSPTFTREPVDDFVVFTGTPPSNMGVTLGGSTRMRSYPVGRFSDKAGMYYSAELRLIPEWNPFKKWPLIRNLPYRWWQLALIVEAGRTAEHWDFGELNSDMNVNYGVGVRIMVGGQVIRFELVTGDEATQFWYVIGHPF